jgi:pilus assembly protein CpaF
MTAALPADQVVATGSVERTAHDARRSTDAVIDEICSAVAHVPGDVREVVTREVRRLLPLHGERERREVVEQAVARLAGLDVLERHLAGPGIDEVIVNADGEVWVDCDGRLQARGSLPRSVVSVVLERILAPTGRRLDRTTPIVDVRLADGSRVCAVVEPVAVGGPCVAIRRHRQHAVALDAFVGGDGATARLLADVVASRCNVLVSGATSSGKTTLLAALLALAPADRLVVCEDTTELALGARNAVRLEARPATADGVAEVDLAALVRTALRLRPDRLVVGEFRGAEVLAAVEAMNTGHDGSVSTCHANGTVDALRRIETLVLRAAPSWPLTAIREQVSRSLDVVVHVERGDGGARRIAEVAEVVPHVDAGGPAVRVLADRTGVVANLARRRTRGTT